VPYYVPVGPRGLLFRVGSFLTTVMGTWVYWRACRRRALLPSPTAVVEGLPKAA
jgi:uncharacterized membrane protein